MSQLNLRVDVSVTDDGIIGSPQVSLDGKGVSVDMLVNAMSAAVRAIVATAINQQIAIGDEAICATILGSLFAVNPSDITAHGKFRKEEPRG